MASFAEQLLQALSQSGAPKMCITTPGNTAYGNFQPPMQITLELLNRDGTPYQTEASTTGTKRALEGSSGDEPAGKRKRGDSKVRRVKTKVLDMVKSLEVYGARIRAIDSSEFQEFKDAYLSDYKLHTTSISDSPPKTHVFLLAEIAGEKQAAPRGFVSANKKEGKYVEALPDGQLRKEEGGTAELVYVGDKNQFTGQAASKWAMLRSDKIYVDNTQ
jgi:hypothetical protein